MIYFRDPGRVLFEIATNEPAFTLDESPADLGSTLRLPPGLDAQRAQIEIETVLPPIKRPRA